MKTCAVGAMLIGATMGVGSSASAGVTWVNDEQSFTRYEVYNWTAGLWARAETGQTGLGALDAYTWAPTVADSILGDPPYPSNVFQGTSVSISGVTSSGQFAGSWSASAFQPNSADKLYSTIQGNAVFEVTGSQRITFGFTAGVGGFFQLADMNDPFYADIFYYSGTGAFSQDITLGAGRYILSFEATTPQNSGFNGMTMFVTVPAPGALALLGAAGLVGGRRRRA
jgi:MYXO-CTERM domain-containing protein